MGEHFALIANRSVFEEIGGTLACRKLARAFFDRVGRDPLLRPLFPSDSPQGAREEFAAFLVQFLGGPSEDSQRRSQLSLRESHRLFPLEGSYRGAWLGQMNQALADAGVREPARSKLRVFFEHASAHLAGSKADGPRMDAELEARWSCYQAMEEAVLALRTGDLNRAIELAGRCGRALLTGLLLRMIAESDPTLLRFVQEQVGADPALAQERYGGRTLLHAAAACGSLTTVQLLLQLGADPNAFDGSKHTPLYSVGDECASAESPDVVRALARAGAQVDAHDGVTKATALHMAARRGNAVVARALLECGADIGLRDRRGDTALERAIHCRKFHVADLLRSWK